MSDEPHDHVAEWHKVAAVSDVLPGSGRELVAGGRIVALFNVAGEFHAMDGICAHQGGPLGKGTLSNGVVTCPWHGWQFQTSDGQHCLNPRICQTTFEVKVEAESVFVRV